MNLEELNLKNLFIVNNILSNFDLTTRFKSLSDFLEFYSIKILEDKESIMYYNNNPIPNQDYTKMDFNTIPLALLEYSKKDVELWAMEKVQKNENRFISHQNHRINQMETTLKYLKKFKNKDDFGTLIYEEEFTIPEGYEGDERSYFLEKSTPIINEKFGKIENVDLETGIIKVFYLDKLSFVVHHVRDKVYRGYLINLTNKNLDWSWEEGAVNPIYYRRPDMIYRG